MKMGRSRCHTTPIKRLKSVCPYLFSLSSYGGVRRKKATQEEMYIETLSNLYKIYSVLYNMHKTHIVAYFDLQ
jgi:hypothetical protein